MSLFGQELYCIGAVIADYDHWEQLTRHYVDIGRRTAEQHGADLAAEFHGPGRCRTMGHPPG